MASRHNFAIHPGSAQQYHSMSNGEEDPHQEAAVVAGASLIVILIAKYFFWHRTLLQTDEDEFDVEIEHDLEVKP